MLKRCMKVQSTNIYGNSLISRSTVDETQFYLYNGRGDVVELSNASSVTIAQYTYDAFGNLLREGNEPESEIQENEGVDNPYRYKGYRYDESTGLYNLNGRLYEPEIVRFTQEYNYYGKVNEPLSLNRYTYNNPIRYWDPTEYVVSKWDNDYLSETDIEKLKEYTKKYEDALRTQKTSYSRNEWEKLDSRF